MNRSSASGLYYETLGRGASRRPPWLLIHGGAGTGAVFRTTVDGRPGWADVLAARGYEVWVADWPGVGRSEGADPLGIDLGAVVEGFVRLVQDVIREPVILVGHSRGASVAWRVAELARPFIAGVVGLAPAPPGNALPAARLVSDDGVEVRLVHPEADVEIGVRLDRLFTTPQEFIDEQWIRPSERLPPEHVAAFELTIVPMPPLPAIQRLGGRGGVPAIEDTASYDGLWIRVVCAPNDPTHAPAAARSLIDLFRSWGADAELVDLAERGVEGNGHFMFCEVNSDDVLAVVLAAIQSRS